MHPLANLMAWLILPALVLDPVRLFAQDETASSVLHSAANQESSVFARLRIPEKSIVEAVSREFHKTQPVDRVVLGTRSRGTTVSRGVVDCQTADNPHGAEVRCYITGTITSQTCGTNGPAVIQSRADSRYSAEKLIFFDGRSFQSRPAEVNVTTRLTITGVGSSAPRLRGRIVRRVASQRVEANHAQAEAITASLTHQDVQRQIDDEFDERIASLNQRFANRLALLRLLSRAGFHLAIRSHHEFIDVDLVKPDAEDKPPPPPVRSEVGETIELWLPIPDLPVPEIPPAQIANPKVPDLELPVPKPPILDAIVPGLSIPGLAGPDSESQERPILSILSSVPGWLAPMFEENPRLKDLIREGLGIERDEKWLIIELSDELLNGADSR